MEPKAPNDCKTIKDWAKLIAARLRKFEDQMDTVELLNMSLTEFYYSVADEITESIVTGSNLHPYMRGELERKMRKWPERKLKRETK